MNHLFTWIWSIHNTIHVAKTTVGAVKLIWQTEIIWRAVLAVLTKWVGFWFAGTCVGFVVRIQYTVVRISCTVASETENKYNNTTVMPESFVFSKLFLIMLLSVAEDILNVVSQHLNTMDQNSFGCVEFKKW